MQLKPTFLPSIALLGIGFWYGSPASVIQNPLVRCPSWEAGRRFVGLVVRQAEERGSAQLLTVDFSFSPPLVASRCETLSMRYSLYVTADGFLVSEDRRIVSSLDQSLAWACHLRLTGTSGAARDQERARLVAEFAPMGLGDLSRLPRSLATAS